MKKNKLIYFLIIIIFTLLVFSITYTYLFIYKESRGKAEFVNKYSDVVFLNVTSEDDLSLKINGNIIGVNVDDINDLIKPKTFYMDATNIGNINAMVDGIYISNISNSEITNDIKVEPSIIKGDIINGGNQKKIKVTISYNGEKIEKTKLKFNINFLFKELSL